jgi:hypothetical protein
LRPAKSLGKPITAKSYSLTKCLKSVGESLAVTTTRRSGHPPPLLAQTPAPRGRLPRLKRLLPSLYVLTVWNCTVQRSIPPEVVFDYLDWIVHKVSSEECACTIVLHYYKLSGIKEPIVMAWKVTRPLAASYWDDPNIFTSINRFLIRPCQLEANVIREWLFYHMDSLYTLADVTRLTQHAQPVALGGIIRVLKWILTRQEPTNLFDLIRYVIPLKGL